ncbi:MAG: FAD:protein FMN transferase [Planctomycetes bacterium]|nr:FAD:protein FMN transferase [Planctomycetota bacterium]
MNPARSIALAALAALPALAQGEGGAPPVEPALELVERRLGVMGTDLQLTVLGEDRAALEATLDAAEAELRRVEDRFTSWRDSELTRLNAAAGQGPFEVSSEQARLVARALRVSELTGGAFDITFASVGKLWDFKADPPRIPSAEAIQAALVHVGYAKVKVDLERSTIELPAGTRIGLGGMAKGYGVDCAMQVYLQRGIKHGMVNAGGDLKALGLKHGKPWEIAIKHPRDRERVLAVIPVSNTCVVTSGDYERFVEVDGKRYHHILDPRTGYPSTGCMSATVIAPDATLADALATALCVLGPEAGLKLVNGLRRVEALVVGLDGTVHRSAGLPAR